MFTPSCVTKGTTKNVWTTYFANASATTPAAPSCLSKSLKRAAAGRTMIAGETVAIATVTHITERTQTMANKKETTNQKAARDQGNAIEKRGKEIAKPTKKGKGGY